MSNYYIKSVDKTHCVIESATNQQIGKFESRKEANEFRDFLNSGGGFDGWTPEFIIKDIFQDIKNLNFINSDY